MLFSCVHYSFRYFSMLRTFYEYTNNGTDTNKRPSQEREEESAVRRPPRLDSIYLLLTATLKLL